MSWLAETGRDAAWRAMWAEYGDFRLFQACDLDQVARCGAGLRVIEIIGSADAHPAELRDLSLGLALRGVSAISLDVYARAVCGLDGDDMAQTPAMTRGLMDLWRNSLAREVSGVAIAATGEPLRDAALIERVGFHLRRGRSAHFMAKGAV